MTTASRASTRIFRSSTTCLFVFAVVAGAGMGLAPSSRAAADSEVRRVDQPNYEQALKYSTEYLRQFVYDTAVTPHWVGKTDVFWYSYRTSSRSLIA